MSDYIQDIDNAMALELYSHERNSSQGNYVQETNPYTTPVPSTYNNYNYTQQKSASELPSTPLCVSGYEVTPNGIVQWEGYCTTSFNTIQRNNATFTENVTECANVQRKILPDGTAYVNESKLTVHSVFDADGNCHSEWNDGDRYKTANDSHGEAQVSLDKFTSNDRAVETTYYNKFFIAFRPVQYNIEMMEFEYKEDKAEFEMYDFVINIPEQTDILSTDNFQTLLDEIIPYAEEQGRLEDTEMLAASHDYHHQMTMRKEKLDVNGNLLKALTTQYNPPLPLENTQQVHIDDQEDIGNAMALLFYPDDINKSQERTTFQEDSSSPSLVSNQYFITFRPIQYDVEVMDFEYHEEKAEFENYDFVINIPEQFDVLSADNFQALLDIIIPYAAEHGRLEDASGTQQVQIDEQVNCQESVALSENEDHNVHQYTDDMYKQTDFCCSLDSTEESILPWSTYSSNSRCSSSLESDMEYDIVHGSFTHSLNTTEDNIVPSVSLFSMCSSKEESFMESETQNNSTHSLNFTVDDITSSLYSICNSSQESVMIDEDTETSFPFARLSCRIFRDEYGISTRFRGNYNELRYRYDFEDNAPAATSDQHVTAVIDGEELEPQMVCSKGCNDTDKPCAQFIGENVSPLENAKTHNAGTYPEESTLNELNLEQEFVRNEIPTRMSRLQRFRQRLVGLKTSIVNAFNTINCFRKQELE